jgi:hypothetical protein
MNIAFLPAPALLAPLQDFLKWLKPMQKHSNFQRSSPAGMSYLRLEPKKTSRAVARKPLRIVRILEAGQAPAAVGRMVMSGRMADVCAELDRLVAREAALH